MRRVTIIVIPLLLFVRLMSAQNLYFSGKVVDKKTHHPIEFAIVTFNDSKHWCTTDEKGNFRIDGVSEGNKKVFVSCLGYKQKKIELNFQTNIIDYVIYLTTDDIVLHEVTVTATESKGLSSSSTITKEAIKLLQPTSFTDLLELLPGGKSQDPNMGIANTIKIREPGSQSQHYDISSLGVSFVVDGTPLQNDANLQTLPHLQENDPHFHRSVVNKGIDMRTISTDEIENVEIVRGIPSVEYGDLTSGLVKIKRKMKPSRWETRIKADEYAKLISLGKGVSFGRKNHNINFNLDYLDSKVDPRNHLENYKRLTGSLRYQFIRKKENSSLRCNASLDYVGSFDNKKIDPDISLVKIDFYESKYNKFRLTNSYEWQFQQNRFIKSLNINTLFSAETDLLTRRKFISLVRDTPIPNNIEEGVHDGAYLPYEYVADFKSEGKPIYAFIKVKSVHPEIKFGDILKTNFTLGFDWNYAKNFGEGEIYDLEKPISPVWESRPRAYKDIPALQRLSLFAENRGQVKLTNSTIYHSLGIRGVSLPGLSKSYAMHNKFFWEPRFNIKYQLPKVEIAKHDWNTSIGYGIGYNNKMPTLAHLYPNKYYNDIVQLNYFNENLDFRRLNILTQIVDLTNYDIQPAKNLKWELRLDINYFRHRVSLTYFEETMNSGFRQMAFYSPIAYRQYDIHSIDHANITKKPELSDFRYEDKVILDGYHKTSNGSSLWKKGIEFQYESPRIKKINTKITANGAWFYTIYKNSQPMFQTVNTVIDGTSLQYKYVGLYDWNNGKIKEILNTNVIIDTQFPRLGLIFALSIQTTWFSHSQIMYQDGTPTAYLGIDGQLHQYGQKEASDKELQHLILNYNPERYNRMTVPFGTLVNLKSSKQIGDFLHVAIFVNRILDFLPDYKSNDILIRRYTGSYFGMELNLKL